MLVSTIGTWLQLTAMALLVYQLTGRATDLGITLALQWLPMLLLGAWAGAVADRRDKLTMAIVTQAGLAVQAIVLGLVALAGLASVPVVWALTLVLGVLNAFDNPARRGLVTELVEPHDIPNASSLNTAVMTGSRIFGPALGAVLVDTVGTAWCFLINGISFAAVLLLAVHDPARRDAPVAACAKGRATGARGAGLRRPPSPTARRPRGDGDRVHVRLQHPGRLAQAGRRPLGRRRVVRARAVGVERRRGDRLPAHRPAGLGLDALVPR